MKQVLLICFVLLLPVSSLATDIALLVIDNNSYLAHLAVDGMEPELGHRVRVFSAGELAKADEEIRTAIDGAKMLVVDVMGRELEEFLIAHINLSGKTIYALRGSSDDEALKQKGFLFDPEVSSYYQHLSRDNIDNMLRLLIGRHLDRTVDHLPVRIKPELGIHHPAAPDIFTTAEAFRRW